MSSELLEVFRDTAIKCHIGFKHKGPWDKCEWIECEDRRKMIESFAPPESTRIAGEQEFDAWWDEYQRPWLPNGIAGYDHAKRAWIAARSITSITTSDSARLAAEEIAKYLDAFTPLTSGDDLVRIFENTIKRNLAAAAPADNDAESLLQHVAHSGVEFDGQKDYVVVQIDRDIWQQIQATTTKGDRWCHRGRNPSD